MKIATLVGLVTAFMLLSVDGSPAQQGSIEADIISTAMRHLRQGGALGPEVRVRFEVRKTAPQPNGGEFDPELTNAVRSLSSGLEIGRAEDVVRCGGSPSTCVMSDTDVLFSVVRTAVTREGGGIDVVIREFRPERLRQPIHKKLVRLEVGRQGSNWVVTKEILLYVS